MKDAPIIGITVEREGNMWKPAPGQQPVEGFNLTISDTEDNVVTAFARRGIEGNSIRLDVQGITSVPETQRPDALNMLQRAFAEQVMPKFANIVTFPLIAPNDVTSGLVQEMRKNERVLSEEVSSPMGGRLRVVRNE